MAPHHKDLRLGPRGDNLIKSFEHLRLEAYLPTRDDVWTIGWGHTAGVKAGDRINIQQAQTYFDLDVLPAAHAVNALPCALTQSMFDALVSLVFNVGPGAIRRGSTIGNALYLQASSGIISGYYAAWAGFALWRKQADRDLLGLARRRAKEMSLFFEDGLP